MNTYDFDKTIFYPDSSVTFVRWYMRRHPLEFLLWLPRMAVIGLAYLLKLIPKETLKENIFHFVRRIDDIDSVLKVYWDEHESWIAPWYRAQHSKDDIVISASPEFLVRIPAQKLGVRLLASRVDRHTGRTDGENCHGAEKVRRLQSFFSRRASRSETVATFLAVLELVRAGRVQIDDEETLSLNAGRYARGSAAAAKET